MSSTRIRGETNEVDHRWFFFGWLLISFWLLACALLVRGEYSDGYQTIANARYFFGDNPDYYMHRGPLAALALWPVEAVVSLLNLHPVDVRPYHVYSGLLHSAYLLGCWLLLKRSFQAFIPRLIAFATAILSVVFFAYAPYISHDIIPGLLFLVLIFLCDRWTRDPTPGAALLLLLAGTAVTFIKQTFAIFWVALCVYAAFAFLFNWDDSRVSARKMLLLFALAGFSGLLSWVGYGWFTAGEISGVSLLERPMVLINSVSVQYDNEADISTLFPPDLYIRNLHNYGIATLLLILPGLVLALRGEEARLRMVAVCWLVSAAALHIVSFKEVRYLAFLAPLSAMLIVPVIQRLLKSRVLFPALLAVVIVDQYRGLTMAAAQLTSTPGMNVTRFVGVVGKESRIISTKYMSFTYMADSPLRRDRYHGIFHLSSDNLFQLNEGKTNVGLVNDPRDLGLAGIEAGDRVFHSNLLVARKPPWEDNNAPPMLADLLMTSGNASMIDLSLNEDRYEISGHEGRYVMFIPRVESGKEMPIVATSSLTLARVRATYGDDVGHDLRVLGVVIDTLCQADQCTYFD